MDEVDNVKVAIRIRPLSTREKVDGHVKKCLTVQPEQNSLALANNKAFFFDFVGDEDISQEEVFEIIGKPIAVSCLAGYNGTIFAYGQTGAGKTFTILGSEQNRGLLPRSLGFIFESVERELEQNPCAQFLLRASYLEIYNESVNDLLNPELKNLQVREGMKCGTYVEGLEEVPVSCLADALELLAKGTKNRHIGDTLMNRESSRSHSVFTLAIESKELKNELWNFKTARFHLIDLAGSERQKLTAASGERLKEAGAINKSLSALGNVINSLVERSEGKSRHVHYRDSKLTFLLKDSIGGNAKTCIIANVSPSMASLAETLSTLRFAERAKMVKNKAVVNEDTVGTTKELKEEISRLKEKLLAAQNAVKSSVCAECSKTGLYSDYSIIVMNERLAELEEVVETNTRIRLECEAHLQGEIDSRQQHIDTLVETLDQMEQQRPVASDSHSHIARLSVENDALKYHLQRLETEVKEAPGSISYRLKSSQEYTERLADNFAKSVKERKQLLAMINERSDGMPPVTQQHVDAMILASEEVTPSQSSPNEATTQRQAQLEEEVAQLSSQLVALEHALKAAETEKEQVQASCRDELLQLQAALEAVEGTNLELEDEVGRVHSELTEVCEELETFRQSAKVQDQALRSDLETSTQTLHDCFAQLEHAVAEKKLLETSLVEERQQLSLLQDAQQKSSAQIQGLTEDNQFLLHSLEQLQQELQQKESEVGRLNTELSTAQQAQVLLPNKEAECSRLAELTAAQQSQLIRLQEENEQLRTTLSQVSATVQTRDSAVHALQQEAQQLETDLADTRKQLEAMTSLCERQTEEVQSKSSTLAILTETLREKIEEAALAQQTLDDNAASYSHMTAEFAAMQAVVHQVRSEEEATKKELAELRDSQRRLQKEVDRLTQENADLVGHNNLNQKIKIHFRLKEENNKLKEMNHKLKEDARKAQERNSTLTKKLEALAKTNGGPAAARKQVTQLEAQIAEQEAVLQRIHDAIKGPGSYDKDKENHETLRVFQEFFNQVKGVSCLAERVPDIICE